MAELYDYNFSGMTPTIFYVVYTMNMFIYILVTHKYILTSYTMFAGAACTESFRAEGALAA